MRHRSRPIKCPNDLIEAMRREFPNSTFPERIRMIYINHTKFNEAILKLDKANSFIYGNAYKKYGNKK